MRKLSNDIHYTQPVTYNGRYVYRIVNSGVISPVRELTESDKEAIALLDAVGYSITGLKFIPEVGEASVHTYWLY